MNYVQQYMDSIETENTKKVAKHIFIYDIIYVNK